MELKDTSVVFQYHEADPDFGSMQAKELASHLEILLAFCVEEC
jgi:hypothetical protein